MKREVPPRSGARYWRRPRSGDCRCRRRRIRGSSQRVRQVRSNEAGGSGDDGAGHGNGGIRSGLVRVLVPQDRRRRVSHMILKSSVDRPVLDVVEVVLDALFDRCVAAPAVHLGPPGHSRLHLVAQHVLAGPAFLELMRRRTAARAAAPPGTCPPRSTFQSCGNSSRLKRRRMRPNAVRRGIVLARPDRPRSRCSAFIEHRPELQAP